MKIDLVHFEAFPEIRTKLRNGGLWNHSYYGISEETVKKYIENQSKQF